jgi:hypothetical protein
MSTTETYQHGDRVRDTRDGTTGTVTVRTDGTREVRWDGLALADELDVAAPYLRCMG